MSDERVIRIIGMITGEVTPFDGQWVVEYDPGRDGTDPNGRWMMCHLVTTPDLAQARRFSATEAVETWSAVNPDHPVRPDGKPNRPLTAFNVEIGPADDATGISDVIADAWRQGRRGFW